MKKIDDFDVLDIADIRIGYLMEKNNGIEKAIKKRRKEIENLNQMIEVHEKAQRDINTRINELELFKEAVENEF